MEFPYTDREHYFLHTISYHMQYPHGRLATPSVPNQAIILRNTVDYRGHGGAGGGGGSGVVVVVVVASWWWWLLAWCWWCWRGGVAGGAMVLA